MRGSPQSPEWLTRLSLAVFRTLLLLYPARFRRVYGQQMALTFRDACRDAVRQRGLGGLAQVWRMTLGDLIMTAISERLEQDMSRTSLALYRTSGLAGLIGIGAWILEPVITSVVAALSHMPGADVPLSATMLVTTGWLFFVVGFIGLYAWLAKRCGALIWLPGLALIAILLVLVVATLYYTYNSQIGVQRFGNTTVVNLSAAQVVNQQLDYYAYAAMNLAYPALGLALFISGALAWRAEPRFVGRALATMGALGMLYYFFTDMGAPSLLRNTGTPGMLGMAAGALAFFGVWLINWLRFGRLLWREGAQATAVSVTRPTIEPAID
ncbi:MAG TPA: hypothetical protein VFN78_11480 [Ktedonobacterales bacterium]|nr:hypothetical protein [Ktedonobacterales bacterium]